jgi:hypothetical protein
LGKTEFEEGKTANFPRNSLNEQPQVKKKQEEFRYFLPSATIPGKKFQKWAFVLSDAMGA